MIKRSIKRSLPSKKVPVKNETYNSLQLIFTDDVIDSLPFSKRLNCEPEHFEFSSEPSTPMALNKQNHKKEDCKSQDGMSQHDALLVHETCNVNSIDLSVAEPEELPLEPERLFSEPESVHMDYENLISLPSVLKYHGFEYLLLCRGTKSRMYQQLLHGETVGYEVSIIKIQKEAVLYGKMCKKHERWPKDGDFGKTAFSYFTIEDAKRKYNKLESVPHPK
jgi:hypothetical protein